jgi:hypothetical protein
MADRDMDDWLQGKAEGKHEGKGREEGIEEAEEDKWANDGGGRAR